ncbi:hypothetical protein AMECASPLE_033767 [Ameca splendens]|uniref:Uncharacterized protein n=1 Tax=Ameca splendens TaxID=208324 RepID=A0ABV0YUE3_9TELE
MVSHPNQQMISKPLPRFPEPLKGLSVWVMGRTAELTDVQKTVTDTLRYAQTNHILNQRQPQSWAKENKKLECCSVVQSKVCISFGNHSPKVWRKSGEAQNPC